jgi:hypothetical protein
LIGGNCGGTIRRTHTVTDDCTNSASCVQIITVRDETPPSIVCPPNVTVQCLSDVRRAPGSLAEFLAEGGQASDNCDTNLAYSSSDGPLIGGACGGTIRRTHTVTDDCANSASCVQIITVRDSTPPSIVCLPNVMVQCLSDVRRAPGSLAEFLAEGGQASDNCDTNLGYSVSDGPLIGGNCGGTIRRTHTVTDDCTNSASCVQVITVRDTTPPSIVCPSDITVSCVSAMPTPPTTLAQFLAAGGQASDNCDTNLTYTASDGPLVGGTCGGTIRRTHTVTDNCTNSASCVQIITVRDSTPPVITLCKPEWLVPVEKVLLPFGSSGYHYLAASDASYLPSGYESLPFDDPIWSEGTAPFGTGFSACPALPEPNTPWPQDSLVLLVSHPIEVPPGAVELKAKVCSLYEQIWPSTGHPWREFGSVVYLNGDFVGGLSSAWDIVHSPDIDPCGSQALPQVYAVPPASIKSGANLLSVATGCYWVLPLVSGFADFEVTATVLGLPDCFPTLAAATDTLLSAYCAQDACSRTVPVILDHVDNSNPCDTRIVLKATDDCGNTSYQTNVVHIDAEPPQLVCAASFSVECGEIWSFGFPLAIDNCDSKPQVEVVNTVTNTLYCGRAYSVTRTWKATDRCGNLATCSQTVSVVDTTPPLITCPSNVTAQCFDDVPVRPTTLAQFLAQGGQASDNCDTNLAYSSSDGPLVGGACGGTIRRTHTVTDDCTNTASCVQVITVRDTTPPSIVCPSNRVVGATSSNGAVVTFTATASDTCDPNPTITCTPPSGSVFPPGTNTVVCRALDACGDASSCSFAVTVHPLGGCLAIQCPSNIVEQCQGVAGARVTFAVTASNQCGGTPSVTCEPPSGSLFAIGPTVVLCTATDGLGRSDACTFVVDVEDNTSPLLRCPSNIVVGAQGPDGALVNFTVGALDDCDTNVTMRCRPGSGSVFPIGATAVYCVAQDRSGNEGHCGFLVTVSNLPPFRVNLMGDNIVLRWHGRGTPEFAVSLTPPIQWQTAICPVIEVSPGEYLMEEAAREEQRYYRIVAPPLAPPADGDDDGVPDRDDRCPQALGGRVVACGCSPIDAISQAELVVGPVLSSIETAAESLRGPGSPWNGAPTNAVFGPVLGSLEGSWRDIALAASQLRAANLPNAMDGYARGLAQLENALSLMEAIIARVADELWTSPIPNQQDRGDVPETAVYLTLLQLQKSSCEDALRTARTTREVLDRTARAETGRATIRGTVVEMEDATRRLRLDNGRIFVMTDNLDTEDDWGVGSEVSLTSLEFEDGTGAVLGLSDVTTNSFPPNVYPIPCIALRVAPFQRFPPFFGGPYLLHAPEGYLRSGALRLEHGMRLAAKTFGCPSQTENAAIVYSLRLELGYTSLINGVYKNLTLANNLRGSSEPVELPSDVDPDWPATLTVVTRRQYCTFGGCGRPEVLGTETYIVFVKPRYSYASATYGATEFDLEDSPNETGYRQTSVTAVSFSLGTEAIAFTAEGYPIVSGTPSHPNIGTVGQGAPFAIYAFDFYTDPENLFSPEPFVGITNAAGLIWPRVTGKHNGFSFRYSCALPVVVRDVVDFCSVGPHSYYRLPWRQGDTKWATKCGGNKFGCCGHQGDQLYAFDFNASEGAEILAPRGGIVTLVCEDQSENTWGQKLKAEPIPGSPCFKNIGNYMYIRHQDGSYAVYFHMVQNGVFPNVGDRVYRGDPIGLVGETGNASRPHLHFEVKPTKPMPPYPNSLLLRFQALDAQGNIKRCFTPEGVCSPDTSDPDGCMESRPGDDLFSNNKPWWK